jgi:hypothetical protein
VIEKIRDDQQVGCLGDLAARRSFARDGAMIDTDTRLEPLPVAVGQ